MGFVTGDLMRKGNGRIVEGEKNFRGDLWAVETVPRKFMRTVLFRNFRGGHACKIKTGVSRFGINVKNNGVS